MGRLLQAESKPVLIEVPVVLLFLNDLKCTLCLYRFPRCLPRDSLPFLDDWNESVSPMIPTDPSIGPRSSLHVEKPAIRPETPRGGRCSSSGLPFQTVGSLANGWTWSLVQLIHVYTHVHISEGADVYSTRHLGARARLSSRPQS